MELIDLLWDISFLLLGISCTLLVIRKRKNFDLWASLPACGAWIVKAVRCFYFDWVNVALHNVKEDLIHSFMGKSHRMLGCLDLLTKMLMCVVFLRLVNYGIYLYKYNKALKALKK